MLTVKFLSINLTKVLFDMTFKMYIFYTKLQLKHYKWAMKYILVYYKYLAVCFNIVWLLLYNCCDRNIFIYFYYYFY